MCSMRPVTQFTWHEPLWIYITPSNLTSLFVHDQLTRAKRDRDPSNPAPHT